MGKKAISVTIDLNNLTWLRGRAAAIGLRSVSELIDRLISEARASGNAGPARSVAGTIDIDISDPLLDTADEAIREQFNSSLRRGVTVNKQKRQSSSNRRLAKRRG
jgi:hypothetical protein